MNSEEKFVFVCIIAIVYENDKRWNAQNTL